MICDLRVVDIPMPFLNQARLLARKNSHLEVLQGLLRVRVIDDNIEDFLYADVEKSRERTEQLV